MSDGIYYNQEVTAEMLNDIAIDLGATSFNGFEVNKFGADELNSITSAIVSKGVLNSYDACKPFLYDGTVYIKSGVIVFANGAKKVISAPLAVEYIAGSYIYALNDTSAGTASIIVGEEPAEGDFVQLAMVTTEGVLADIRTFATAKIPLNVVEPNEYIYFDITHQVWQSHNSSGFDTKSYTDYMLPEKDFKYLYLFDTTTTIDWNALSEPKLFDLEQTGALECRPLPGASLFLHIYKEGRKLKIWSVGGYGYNYDDVHTFSFMLF